MRGARRAGGSLVQELQDIVVAVLALSQQGVIALQVAGVDDGEYPFGPAAEALADPEQCGRSSQVLVASGRGGHPHTDRGVVVSRIHHRARHPAMSSFTGLFKNVVEPGGQVPIKGPQPDPIDCLGVRAHPLTASPISSSLASRLFRAA